MTAKDYLRRARTLKRDIGRKSEQIQQLHSMATRATGSHEALRVSGTPNHSKLEDAVIRLIEIGDELGASMQEYAKAYREIASVIEAVDNPIYRQLLTLRYLDAITWEEIAVKMHYSWKHVHKVHSQALDAVKVDTQ